MTGRDIPAESFHEVCDILRGVIREQAERIEQLEARIREKGDTP